MMPEWHQLDSSSTMPQQQESTKKKTLKSSSRSFWFSTGLSVNSIARFLKFTLKYSRMKVLSHWYTRWMRLIYMRVKVKLFWNNVYMMQANHCGNEQLVGHGLICNSTVLYSILVKLLYSHCKIQIRTHLTYIANTKKSCYMKNLSVTLLRHIFCIQ